MANSRPLPVPRDKWEAIAAELELSPKQTLIAEYILCGYPDKQIVTLMKISKATVRSQIARIFAKSKAYDRQDLIVLVCACSHGLHTIKPQSDDSTGAVISARAENIAADVA
jgi:DNA-binding NarL/FixJ family response regulator